MKRKKIIEIFVNEENGISYDIEVLENNEDCEEMLKIILEGLESYNG